VRATSPRWPISFRHDIVGDEVTFVANRNINYTNVCTFKCKFCAFSKGPCPQPPGPPYLLELSEITDRVAEAEAMGATEVCLQGGYPPQVRRRLLPRGHPGGARGVVHHPIHGFTALEVTEGAPAVRGVPGRLPGPVTRRRSADPARHRRRDPRRRGSAPSCARTRSTPSSGWRRTGPPTPSGSTPTSPSCSGPSSSRARVGTAPRPYPRPCQLETGGFNRVRTRCRSCTWPPRSTSSGGRAGVPTFRETLLMHAVGRIAYRGAIDNIQLSWVKASAPREPASSSGPASTTSAGTLIDEKTSPGPPVPATAR